MLPSYIYYDFSIGIALLNRLRTIKTFDRRVICMNY